MDLSSIGLINIVPHFCPNLSKVCYGHWQGTSGSIPHSLCDEERYFDSKLNGYQNLTHFEAAGNILLNGFLFPLGESRKAQKYPDFRGHCQLPMPTWKNPCLKQSLL